MAYVYTDALKAAQEELLSAIRQRDHWTLEVVRLQQLVKSLAITTTRNYFHQAQADSVGFQEIVLTAVRMASVPMTPVGIRNNLLVAGYDLSRYSNPLEVIYSVLKRRQLYEFEPGRYCAVPSQVVAPRNTR